VHVGEIAEVIHHPRTREGLRLDAIDNAEVDAVLRTQESGEAEQECRGDDDRFQAHGSDPSMKDG
jgi:hypothetical protein